MTEVDETVAHVRAPGLDAVDMDGELVMMGLEQGEYYALRGSAASLWQHLAEPRTVDDLCGLLAQEYDVAAIDCRADVAAFLADALGRGLVRPATDPR